MKKIILTIACIMLCACASTNGHLNNDFDLNDDYETYTQRQKTFENVKYEYVSTSQYKVSTTVDEQDDTDTYYGGYSSEYTYVRGHYRHYKSGKVTYVRPYYRRK